MNSKVRDHRSPSPPKPLVIRLVPDLSAAALRSNQDKELALWHCLRAINHWGSGTLNLEVAFDSLIDTFGYGQRSIYRYLRLGNGRFWDLCEHKGIRNIQIYSLVRIARNLSTSLPSDCRFREIDTSCFRTLKQRRVQLWASILKPEGLRSNPMSRAYLEEYTSVLPRQQRRYDKTASVGHVCNYAYYEGNNGNYHRWKQRIITKQKEYEINKELPRTYHSKQTIGPRGMLKKVRAELHRGSLLPAEAPRYRRYFDNIQKLIRDKVKGWDTCCLLIPAHDQGSGGAMKWCLISS